MPSVACLVGEAIGAAGVGAMDLAAACAGFSYAASVAVSMLRVRRRQAGSCSSGRTP